MSTKRVTRNGGSLAYDVRGAGPPVLWIQGVGVHGDGWRPQFEALENRFTCISFDHRGVGRSDPQEGELEVEQMAADSRAILDAERIDSAHVVGHSLGGLVALQLALDARERVKSLALLCTFPSGKLAAPLTGRMMSLGMQSRVGTRRMRRHGFLRLVLAPSQVEREDLDGLAARLEPLFGHDLADQPPIVAKQLSALRRSDPSSRLRELEGIRALIVAAEHDPIAPPSLGRALAQAMPGSRFVEFADASHGLPITHAEAVNSLLVDFFEGK